MGPRPSGSGLRQAADLGLGALVRGFAEIVSSHGLTELIVDTKGTTLTLHARYDNSLDNPDNPSNPPQRVTHGEQTTNEMCICFCEFLANNQQEANQIRKQVTRELVSSAIARKMAGEK